MISYYTEGVEMPPIQQSEITAWVKAVAGTYDKRVGEIAYIFCSDEKILEVNRQYLQHDYYTDIITFDYHVRLLSGKPHCGRPVHQSGHDTYQCRTVPGSLRDRTPPGHHPRHPAPLRHQRQRTG